MNVKNVGQTNLRLMLLIIALRLALMLLVKDANIGVDNLFAKNAAKVIIYMSKNQGVLFLVGPALN